MFRILIYLFRIRIQVPVILLNPDTDPACCKKRTDPIRIQPNIWMAKFVKIQKWNLLLSKPCLFKPLQRTFKLFKHEFFIFFLFGWQFWPVWIRICWPKWLQIRNNWNCTVRVLLLYCTTCEKSVIVWHAESTGNQPRVSAGACGLWRLSLKLVLIWLDRPELNTGLTWTMFPDSRNFGLVIQKSSIKRCATGNPGLN